MWCTFRQGQRQRERAIENKNERERERERTTEGERERDERERERERENERARQRPRENRRQIAILHPSGLLSWIPESFAKWYHRRRSHAALVTIGGVASLDGRHYTCRDKISRPRVSNDGSNLPHFGLICTGSPMCKCKPKVLRVHLDSA